MTSTLAPVRSEASTGRTTFALLSARELRRFVVNPVFLVGVAMAMWTMRRSYEIRRAFCSSFRISFRSSSSDVSLPSSARANYCCG